MARQLESLVGVHFKQPLLLSLQTIQRQHQAQFLALTLFSMSPVHLVYFSWLQPLCSQKVWLAQSCGSVVFPAVLPSSSAQVRIALVGSHQPSKWRQLLFLRSTSGPEHSNPSSPALSLQGIRICLRSNRSDEDFSKPVRKISSSARFLQSIFPSKCLSSLMHCVICRLVTLQDT